MPVQCSTVTLTSSITVADGVFAPGHLGELTRHLPFELVDDVLERVGGVQRRLRLLPSRVGVYFVLALVLFPQLGYVRVWDKLAAGVRGLLSRSPSEKALREVRRRLGVAPFRLLFETLAGPVAQPITPGVRYRRWRTVAFDGCSSTKAPDRPSVCAWLGKHKHRYGTDGYPMLKIMALCETGTRALLGAVFGPTPEKETGYAEQLLPLLEDGMLLLNDRGFDSDDFLAKAAATGAQLLVRLKGTRTPARWALLPDGSFLTRINGTHLRIIDAHIAATTAKGPRLGGHYRLATTLTDHRRYPAAELVELYHERWEIESAFYSLRHTLQHGLVLRSQDPAGIQQELWACLTVYQALRRAMVEAVETVPGTDPDRASFTVALEIVKDQLIAAADVLSESGPGRITSALLHHLLPPRRPRGHCHVGGRRGTILALMVVGGVVRGECAVVQGAPLSGRDHQPLRVAVPPISAVLPRGRGAHARARRGRLVRDDPAMLPQVRAGLRRLRRRRPRPGDKWYMDEVFIKINGRLHYLWRAVDQDGNVLDILVQPRRNAQAAKRFFRRLLKDCAYVPRLIVTDKLRSYGAAHRTVMPSVEHRSSKYLNNRAENSHQPTRQRERAMRRFTSAGHAQRFLSAFSGISPHFRPRRHLITAPEYRTEMTDRFTTWRTVTGCTEAA